MKLKEDQNNILIYSGLKRWFQQPLSFDDPFFYENDQWFEPFDSNDSILKADVMDNSFFIYQKYKIKDDFKSPF